MDKQTKKLLKNKNVVMVGKGIKITNGKNTGRPAIVVGVIKKKASYELAKKDIIPRTIKGQETDVIETGEIGLLVKKKSVELPKVKSPIRTDKWRPAPPGVSIGHYHITAGTLGCWVTLKDAWSNREQYIVKIPNGVKKWLKLSNNHVFAKVNKGEIGDSILQPGAYDGGKLPDDEIGYLYDFVEIKMGNTGSDCPFAGFIANLLNLLARILRRKTRFSPVLETEENLVDCALAAVNNNRDIEREILEIGIPTGIDEPTLGMTVKKSGRTTGLTTGIVAQLEAAVQVNMGEGGTALFVDQVIITGDGFSAGGDSGSVILNNNHSIVGLLFAGGSGITVANRFSNVVSALGIDEV